MSLKLSDRTYPFEETLGTSQERNRTSTKIVTPFPDFSFRVILLSVGWQVPPIPFLKIWKSSFKSSERTTITKVGQQALHSVMRAGGNTPGAGDVT